MMTPQEKAHDLYLKYDWNKIYVHICVDEIIDNILKFDPSIDYWKQVKLEIDKL